MKNILLALLLTYKLIAAAHEPVISMYKTKQDPEVAPQQKISSAKKGCYYLAFSGVTLITTAALNQAKNSIESPDPIKFETIEAYHSAFDKYTRHQAAYRTSMNASLTATGLSVIIASFYFLESKIFETKATALYLKPGVGSVGLCLNLK